MLILVLIRRTAYWNFSHSHTRTKYQKPKTNQIYHGYQIPHTDTTTVPLPRIPVALCASTSTSTSIRKKVPGTRTQSSREPGSRAQKTARVRDEIRSTAGGRPYAGAGRFVGESSAWELRPLSPSIPRRARSMARHNHARRGTSSPAFRRPHAHGKHTSSTTSWARPYGARQHSAARRQ